MTDIIDLIGAPSSRMSLLRVFVFKPPKSYYLKVKKTENLGSDVDRHAGGLFVKVKGLINLSSQS